MTAASTQHVAGIAIPDTPLVRFLFGAPRGHRRGLQPDPELLMPERCSTTSDLKYHFITEQGIEFWTQAEGDLLAGTDPEYHTRDLYEAIERGDHPSWTLKVQIMPFEDAATYRFNPFDLTKVWKHADYPLIEVGKMTLDGNHVDNHTEIEQAALQPNNMVPESRYAGPYFLPRQRQLEVLDADRLWPSKGVHWPVGW